jgi:hypothetical protein
MVFDNILPDENIRAYDSNEEDRPEVNAEKTSVRISSLEIRTKP